MSKRDIVFIGAHPDDIERCAGTLLRLKDQYTIHDWCLTSGQRGYKDDSGLTGLDKAPRDDVAELREAEERAACAMLGCEPHFFRQIDGELYAGREICEKVAGMLRELQPRAVFTLWPLEKPDHAAAANIAHMAMCKAELTWTSELIMGLMHREGYHPPRPDCYVNTSTVIHDKRRFMQCYPSQYSDEHIEKTLQLDAFNGTLAWCDHAEAFALAFPMMGTRWERRAENGSLLWEL